MKKLLLFTLPLFVLISCKSKKAKNDILTPANLQSQSFAIDPERDTVLRTSHSSILRIRKGTFKTGKPVSIEIKEAFTPAEILLAGMTTLSDDQPLRSAGMLYFNATVDGKAVKPEISIETTIPAKEPDPAMQLFKGEEKNDGTINWTDPQPLDTSKPDKQLYERGRALFLSKCASCHSVFKETAYPALRDLQYRGPWRNPANILAWVRNPAAFMARDKYTQYLRSKFGSMMTAFVDVTMDDITGLLQYINSVETEEKYPSLANLKADTAGKTPVTTDCSTADTIYVSTRNDFEEYDTTSYPDVFPDTLNTGDPADSSLDDIYDEGYVFPINDNGWYNIDQYLKATKSQLSNVEITADLIMKEDHYMDVYLLIPTERLLDNSVKKTGNQYRFDLGDGKIPLPIGSRGIIIAVGKNKDKTFYGVSEFTIKEKQLIPIEIKETTPEALNDLLRSNKIDNVGIEAVEKKMEILKKPCPGTTEDDYEINPADIEPRKDSTNKN